MALGYMRRHKGWLKYVFLFIVAAFIILYIPTPENAAPGSSGEAIGHVADVPITAGEYRTAYVRQRRLYDQLYQGRMTPEVLAGLQLDQQVFDALVQRHVVRIEAERLGLTIPDAEVARRIRTHPEFQSDGRFIGAAEVRSRLELQGRSVRDFEAEFRTALLYERLRALITDGVGVTPDEIEAEYRLRNERARIEFVKVDSERYAADLTADDAEIQARFDARKDDYRIAERRAVSYVILDAEAMRSRVSVTDAELQAYYQGHTRDFSEPEEVCASHILFRSQAGDSADDARSPEQARGLAEDALRQARAGADFGTLATTLSEDRGTAPRGGDLGCFGRGRMVAPFENAAFGLEAGALSEVVETPFGFHVIKVHSKREARSRAFEDVKEQIRGMMVDRRAAEEIRSHTQRMAAAIRAGRDLDAVAHDQGLTVVRSAPLEAGAIEEPLASPVLVGRAFEMSVGETADEPFRLPNGNAFIRLDEIEASHLPALDAVRDAVRADVIAEKALAQALEVAQGVAGDAASRGLERAAASRDLIREETDTPIARGAAFGSLGASSALERAAFTMPENALSEPLRVAGGYAVIRVLERTGFDPVALETQRDQMARDLTERKRDERFQAYIDTARRRLAVDIVPEAWERVVGDLG